MRVDAAMTDALRPNRSLLFACGLALAAGGLVSAASRSPGDPASCVPVLAYHRFGAVVSDAMTVKTESFRSQLRFLQDHGRSVIPLQTLLDALADPTAPLPDRAAVITVDDGHRSVWAEMWPVIRDARVPVTLFIYPSAISNASYAMTWEQLEELRRTGLVDIQAHTYWHPRFDREKGRLAPAAYEAFVASQLTRSRAVLERRLGKEVSAMAWPFGLYDGELLERARRYGYRAAFTLDCRAVSRTDDSMALPRCLVTDTGWRETFRTFTTEHPR
jgi:peptidoglycan/xylan/chitin deacetylase (PgdA/CDA1 family)